MTEGPKPSERSQSALDWLNFFVADVETGFGPFIVSYLTVAGWSQGPIGLVLTAGSVAGIASQLPGGAVVDAVRSKRAVLVVALVMTAASALLLFSSALFWVVIAAQVLHGATAGLITPAKTSIGLGLVGRRGLSVRVARNHKFDAFGNAGTAAAMGLLGRFIAARFSFLFAAALCIPAGWSLWRIDGKEIDHRRARAARGADDAKPARYRDLLKNWQLLVFGLVLVLFQAANAPAIPLVTERLGQAHEHAPELVVAGMVLVPQLITAFLAVWAGRQTDRWGRKPMLLVAMAALVLRLLLFALVPGPLWLLPIQALSGIDAVVIGILTPLVVAEVTTGSGRFNLALGAMGLATGLGAALSNTVVGYVTEWFGFTVGLYGLAAVALAGLAVAWVALRESRDIPDD